MSIITYEITNHEVGREHGKIIRGDIGKYVRLGLITEGFQKSLDGVSYTWIKALWEGGYVEDHETVKLYYELQPESQAISACIS